MNAKMISVAKNGYQLLVIDIDGTLLGRGGISPEDKAALLRVRRDGIKIALSTGRALKACRGVVKELDLSDYHVWFDGALVSTPDLVSELWVRPLDPKLVKDMVDFSRERSIDLELYSALDYMAERETWSTHAHEDFFGVDCVFTEFAGVWDRERVVKGGVVASEADEPAIKKLFTDRFGERINISEARTPNYPGVVFNNILAPDVSKGTAVRHLAEHMGISREHIMAVGDGMNDLPLFTAAGLAVAMGNASDKVKAAAHQVTLDVDHSGLSAAIEKFLI